MVNCLESNKEKMVLARYICNIVNFLIIAFVILGTKIELFSVFALALAAVMIIIDDVDNNLYLLLFLMPFAGVFKSLSFSEMSFFTILEIILLFKLLVIKKNAIDISLVFIIIFGSYMLINTNDIIESLKLIANVLLLLLLSKEINKISFKKSIFILSISIILSSVIAYFFYDFFNISLYVEKIYSYIDSDLFVERFSGLSADPNYYCVSLVVCLFGLSIYLTEKKVSFLFPILFFILFLFGLQSNSKSFFIMLIIVLIFLCSLLIVKKKIFRFSIIILIIISIFLLSTLNYIDIFDEILLRFGNGNDLNAITTNRTLYWKLYINYIFNNPMTLLFGDGALADLVYSTGPHNSYIDLILYFGVIGTSLYILMIVAIFKENVKLNLYSIIYYIFIFIMYFFISGIFYNELIFHLLIGQLLTYNLRKKRDI